MIIPEWSLTPIAAVAIFCSDDAALSGIDVGGDEFNSAVEGVELSGSRQNRRRGGPAVESIRRR